MDTNIQQRTERDGKGRCVQSHVSAGLMPDVPHPSAARLFETKAGGCFAESVHLPGSGLGGDKPLG